MIEVVRLLELLSPHGFQLGWERWLGAQFNFNFVRSSLVDGVFEHVDVDSMGKRGEAVYCNVWLSPVRGHRLHFKPSPEVDEFVAELGDLATGHTLIKSPGDAIDWELRVAQIAPERVRKLAQRHAHREMSDEPVMEYLTYQLSCRTTLAQQQQAEQFKSGAVWGNVQDASRCAAIAMVLFGAEIDSEHGGFADEPANKSCELKLRLNIAADILRLGVP